MDDVRRWTRMWAASVAACAVVWAVATWSARRLDEKFGSTVL